MECLIDDSKLRIFLFRTDGGVTKLIRLCEHPVRIELVEFLSLEKGGGGGTGKRTFESK
jgi:hypothetical protein